MGYKRTTKFIEKENHYECYTKSGCLFLISKCDYEKVSKYSWCESKTKRIVANVHGKVVYLWRYLLDNPDGVVDHINGNNKDNRRENLRITDIKGNGRNNISNNKFGCNGIKLTKYNRYYARITVDYKEIYLGTFKTLEEAISARIKAKKKYFGEYAPTARYNLSNFQLSI